MCGVHSDVNPITKTDVLVRISANYIPDCNTQFYTLSLRSSSSSFYTQLLLTNTLQIAHLVYSFGKGGGWKREGGGLISPIEWSQQHRHIIRHA